MADDNDEITPEDLEGVETRWLGGVQKSGAKLTRNMLQAERYRLDQEAKVKNEARAEKKKMESWSYKLGEALKSIQDIALKWLVSMFIAAGSAITAWWCDLF